MANSGPVTAAAPVPPDFAEWITANNQGGYNITPTGIDDSEHIQWAVDNADPHGRILLTTGNDGASDFYLSRGIYASNFVGDINGDGRDRTVLHTLNGYDAQMPFAFHYDRRLGYSWVDQGHVDIGHFKLVVDGPTTVWANHGAPSSEVPGVVFIVDVYLVDLHFSGSPQPWPDTGVDVRVHDIWAVGEHRTGEGYPWGTTLLWPVDIEFVKGGDISIQNVRMDETHFTYLRPLYDCDVEIRGIELNAPVGFGVTFQAFGGSLTVHDSTFGSIRSPTSAMFLEGPYGGSLAVHDIVTENASGVAYHGSLSAIPSAISIHDNQIDQPDGAQWGAIEIWDGNAGDAISIADNTITSRADAWPAIFVAEATDAQIQNNKVSTANRIEPGDGGFTCWVPPCGGIKLQSSSAIVHHNRVSYTGNGMVAVDSRAEFRFNKVAWVFDGIAATDGSAIIVEGNKFIKTETDIYADASSSITQIDD